MDSVFFPYAGGLKLYAVCPLRNVRKSVIDTKFLNFGTAFGN